MVLVVKRHNQQTYDNINFDITPNEILLLQIEKEQFKDIYYYTKTIWVTK